MGKYIFEYYLLHSIAERLAQNQLLLSKRHKEKQGENLFWQMSN